MFWVQSLWYLVWNLREPRVFEIDSRSFSERLCTIDCAEMINDACGVCVYIVTVKICYSLWPTDFQRRFLHKLMTAPSSLTSTTLKAATHPQYKLVLHLYTLLYTVCLQKNKLFSINWPQTAWMCFINLAFVGWMWRKSSMLSHAQFKKKRCAIWVNYILYIVSCFLAFAVFHATASTADITAMTRQIIYGLQDWIIWSLPTLAKDNINKAEKTSLLAATPSSKYFCFYVSDNSSMLRFKILVLHWFVFMEAQKF